MKINITGIALIAIGIILIGLAEFNRETVKNSLNLSPDRIKKNNEETSSYLWLAFFGLTLVVGGNIVIEPEKKSVHKKSLPAMQELTYTNTFTDKAIKQLRHQSYNSRVSYLTSKLNKPIARPQVLKDKVTEPQHRRNISTISLKRNKPLYQGADKNGYMRKGLFVYKYKTKT